MRKHRKQHRSLGRRVERFMSLEVQQRTTGTLTREPEVERLPASEPATWEELVEECAQRQAELRAHYRAVQGDDVNLITRRHVGSNRKARKPKKEKPIKVDLEDPRWFQLRATGTLQERIDALEQGETRVAKVMRQRFGPQVGVLDANGNKRPSIELHQEAADLLKAAGFTNYWERKQKALVTKEQLKRPQHQPKGTVITADEIELRDAEYAVIKANQVMATAPISFLQ